MILSQKIELIPEKVVFISFFFSKDRKEKHINAGVVI